MPFKPSNPDKLVWMEGNKEASIVQWHFQTRQRSEFMEILASISGDVGGQRACFLATNIALPLGHKLIFVLPLQEVTVSDSA